MTVNLASWSAANLVKKDASFLRSPGVPRSPAFRSSEHEPGATGHLASDRAAFPCRELREERHLCCEIQKRWRSSPNSRQGNAALSEARWPAAPGARSLPRDVGDRGT